MCQQLWGGLLGSTFTRFFNDWQFRLISSVFCAGLVAEEFLERSASQLTVHGLCELSESLREGQLAVLFRNNHFNTIYKKNVSRTRE